MRSPENIHDMAACTIISQQSLYQLSRLIFSEAAFCSLWLYDRRFLYRHAYRITTFDSLDRSALCFTRARRLRHSQCSERFISKEPQLTDWLALGIGLGLCINGDTTSALSIVGQSLKLTIGTDALRVFTQVTLVARFTSGKCWRCSGLHLVSLGYWPISENDVLVGDRIA
ncbi:MAG: hypothetical protein E7K92_11960 [Serratia marcescens]|nr:hypothetical protein [Serratia marcescens]